MNLFRAFAVSASAHREKTALYWGEDELSYGTYLTSSVSVAQTLSSRYQVRPGDRVALWLKNSPEFVTGLFGVLGAGAVATPINNFLKPDEVNYILKDAGIRVLITHSALWEGHQSSEQAPLFGPEVVVMLLDQLPGAAEASASEHLPGYGCAASELAVIIYTSGTTGRPKGAMLTHANLLSNVDSCRQVLAAIQEDRFVILLPMFHSFMLTVGILLPFLVGGSVVLIRSLHPPKNVLQEIIHRRATLLPAIPQFFRTLAEVPVLPPLPLRLCVSGAAPLPRQVLEDFSAKVPVPLLEGYGLSEASPVVTMNPLAGPWKAGSIGVPIPGVEVTIQNEEGQSLKPFETGELCVRGPNVMLGYWNQPEESARAFRNDWLLTGDIGHHDEEGYFYITDRKKDMLLVNGINVYPREIEEILYQFPGVREAAVIGIPDRRKGEQPVAFVSLVEGAKIEEKELTQFLRGKLADYKVPRRITFLPVLPRNSTGKILKTALRNQAA